MSGTTLGGNTEGRPDSTKSGNTQMTAPTQNMTQFTGHQTVNTFNSQDPLGQNYVIDPSKRLTYYIQFDPTLAREPVIGQGKEGNFDIRDEIVMKGGVQLTQFAPSKEDIERNARLGGSRDDSDHQKAEGKPRSFEEKMALRAQQDAGVVR